jgi:indole-3-acetate monooxygenase
MHGTLATTAPNTLDTLFEAARSLKPQIDAVRSDLDRQRRLPPQLVEAMRAAGIFSLRLPRTLGGPELTVIDFIRVIEQMARFDGSVGWCASIGACYSGLAGYLAPDVAASIFHGGHSVLAGTLM